MTSRNMTVVLLSLILVGVSFGVAQEEADREKPAIRDLMKEREQVLQKLVDIAKAQHQMGSASWGSVVAAERALLDAKLDSATTPAERITILELQLKLAQTQEQKIARLVEVADVSPSDLMTAKASRLTAHIQLLREKASR